MWLRTHPGSAAALGIAICPELVARSLPGSGMFGRHHSRRSLPGEKNIPRTPPRAGCRPLFGIPGIAVRISLSLFPHHSNLGFRTAGEPATYGAGAGPAPGLKNWSPWACARAAPPADRLGASGAKLRSEEHTSEL